MFSSLIASIAFRMSSININKATLNITLFNKEKLPLLVFVWKHNCDHCSNFVPKWNEIVTDTNYRNKIIFADLECSSPKQNNLCSKYFYGTATPRFYWYESTNVRPKVYTGHYLKSSLLFFIDKMLSSSLIEIKSFKEITDARQNNPTVIQIIFNISNQDTESLKIAEQSTKLVQHLPIQCLLYNDTNEHSPLLYGYSDFLLPSFQGKWNLSNIIYYLKKRSIFYMSLFTQKHYVDAESLKIPLSVFVLNENKKADYIREFATIADQYFPVTYTYCKQFSYICRFTSKYPENDGYYVVIDKNNFRYYVYDLIDDKYKFIDFLRGSFHGNISYFGTGRKSIISKYKFDYYESRALGTKGSIIFLVSLFSPVVFLISNISLLYTCIYYRKYKNTYTKQTKTE